MFANLFTPPSPSSNPALVEQQQEPPLLLVETKPGAAVAAMSTIRPYQPRLPAGSITSAADASSADASSADASANAEGEKTSTGHTSPHHGHQATLTLEVAAANHAASRASTNDDGASCHSTTSTIPSAGGSAVLATTTPRSSAREEASSTTPLEAHHLATANAAATTTAPSQRRRRTAAATTRSRKDSSYTLRGGHLFDVFNDDSDDDVKDMDIAELEEMLAFDSISSVRVLPHRPRRTTTAATNRSRKDSSYTLRGGHLYEDDSDDDVENMGIEELKEMLRISHSD